MDRRRMAAMAVVAVFITSTLWAQAGGLPPSLAGTVFGDEYVGDENFSSSYLGFLEDTFVYLAVSGGDGGVDGDGVYGSYTFDRGVVTLTPKARFRGADAYNAEVVGDVEFRLRLEPSQSDLRFGAYLVGDMLSGDGSRSVMRFADRRTALGVGSLKTLKGVPVELVNRWGITKNSLNVREAPSPTAAQVKGIRLGRHSLDRYDALPKDTRLKIIARTQDKSTVGSWTNYWYLISVGEFLKDVWVFGEFVEVSDDSILGQTPTPGALLGTVLMGLVRASSLRGGDR